ncbi:hypothetical protein ACLOJK_036393 [Asimina triloba]
MIAGRCVIGSEPRLPDGTMVERTVDRNGLPGSDTAALTGRGARWMLGRADLGSVGHDVELTPIVGLLKQDLLGGVADPSPLSIEAGC